MNNNINRDYATENMNLQKEIAELKDKVACLKEENEGLQNLYECSKSKIKILKLENEKLHKDYGLLDTTMESDDRIICELLKEKEQLKNDIKLNEAQIDDLTLEVANYKHALEEKNEIIMDLKKENQELLVNKNFAQGVALKYKKAIEILKNRGLTLYCGQHSHIPFISLKDCGDGVCISVEEENSLKEVLEC